MIHVEWFCLKGFENLTLQLLHKTYKNVTRYSPDITIDNPAMQMIGILNHVY